MMEEAHHDVDEKDHAKKPRQPVAEPRRMQVEGERRQSTHPDVQPKCPPRRMRPATCPERCNQPLRRDQSEKHKTAGKLVARILLEAYEPRPFPWQPGLHQEKQEEESASAGRDAHVLHNVSPSLRVAPIRVTTRVSFPSRP